MTCAPSRSPSVHLVDASPASALQIGSIYEYSAGNPIFGVVEKESPLWAPILIFFAVTGLPMVRAPCGVASAISTGRHGSWIHHVSELKSSPAQSQSGYLFYRSVKSANEASERADKIDGY